METKLRIATFPHWFQPEYKLADFLREQGIPVKNIDYTKRGYLDDVDVLIVEQNGFNDYLENDWEYLQSFVKRGGIYWITHQDYSRWTNNAMPAALRNPILVHRYFRTISTANMSYLLPKIEPAGRALFSCPEKIDFDDLMYWEVPGNTFTLTTGPGKPEMLCTAADSCVIGANAWEVLGSYQDMAVRDAALVLQARYGKGLYFWSQILFPEARMPEDSRPMRFWRKFVANVLHSFAKLRSGQPVQPIVSAPCHLPEKTFHHMIAHLHSLDWYGADASPNAIAAAMKHLGFDIGILGVKDGEPLRYARDFEDISDGRVLLLPGQEFHPFNFEDSKWHNAYHILALGVSDYAPQFTRSLFDQGDIEGYLREAADFIHSCGGIAIATHPYTDYWKYTALDGADANHDETIGSLAGSALEALWLQGRHAIAFASVDMWGVKRLADNPMSCFIHIDGVPTQTSVMEAIRRGRLMPSFRISEADVHFEGLYPGDTLPPEMLGKEGVLTVSVKSQRPLRELRLYGGAELVLQRMLEGQEQLALELPFTPKAEVPFFRLEILGSDQATLLAMPFFSRN